MNRCSDLRRTVSPLSHYLLFSLFQTSKFFYISYGATTPDKIFESRHQNGKQLWLLYDIPSSDIFSSTRVCWTIQFPPALCSCWDYKFWKLKEITVWNHYCHSFCEPEIDLVDITSAHEQKVHFCVLITEFGHVCYCIII